MKAPSSEFKCTPSNNNQKKNMKRAADLVNINTFIVQHLWEMLLTMQERFCGKVVTVLNLLSSMPWRHMGKWRCSSTILDLGTRWRWVVSFTLRPPYLWGKGPQYPLDRSLGGPQRRSGRNGEEKMLTCRESNPSRAAHRYTHWAMWLNFLFLSIRVHCVPLSWSSGLQKMGPILCNMLYFLVRNY
jgi:hypothetical protein